MSPPLTERDSSGCWQLTGRLSQAGDADVASGRNCNTRLFRAYRAPRQPTHRRRDRDRIGQQDLVVLAPRLHAEPVIGERVREHFRITAASPSAGNEIKQALDRAAHRNRSRAEPTVGVGEQAAPFGEHRGAGARIAQPFHPVERVGALRLVRRRDVGDDAATAPHPPSRAARRADRRNGGMRSATPRARTSGRQQRRRLPTCQSTLPSASAAACSRAVVMQA